MQSPSIRKALGMEHRASLKGGPSTRDGYEGRVANTRDLIDASRRKLLMQLVCGECGHRSAACDCPMSVRPTPLIPYREFLKRTTWRCDGE